MITEARKLLVVIPALNESATVGRLVKGVPRAIEGIGETVVVVIDDGSTDGTAEVARAAGARVIRRDRPRGVGAVFHDALALVPEEGADILVFMDGDGQFSPADIPKLVGPILAGEADFVSGSRYHPESPPQRQSLGRRIGNWGMSRLISFLTGRKFYDAACGFRAYSAEVAMSLNLTGRFTYTQEVLLDLSFNDWRIREVPVRVRGTRRHGRSRVAKSLVNYAIRASTIILRVYRDYKPLHFFGLLALVQFVIASCLAVFFWGHYLKTGSFTPYLSVGLTSGFLFLMGAITCLMGLLADMFARIRKCLDKLLYYERRKCYEARRTRPGAATSDGQAPAPRAAPQGARLEPVEITKRLRMTRASDAVSRESGDAERGAPLRTD